jgi:hypothetical protein
MLLKPNWLLLAKQQARLVRRRRSAGEGFDSELGGNRQVRKKIKEKGVFDGRRDLLDEEGLERQRQYRRRAQMASSQSTAAPRKVKNCVATALHLSGRFQKPLVLTRAPC